MARRILAITLLIAFGFPVVAPIFAATADPEASLPPCCRSHGAHHCAMMHRMMLAASGAPAFVPSPCPFYPTTATAPRVTAVSLNGPIALSVVPVHAPAPAPAASRRVARTLVASANLKRGPPTLA